MASFFDSLFPVRRDQRGLLDVPELNRSHGGIRDEVIQGLLGMMQSGVTPSGELEHSHGGPLVSGALDSIRSGVTLARDALEGRVDPMSDEGIGRAGEMAGLAMTGGIGGAAKQAGETVLGAGPFYHGSRTPGIAAPRASERGRFGPGVYGTGQDDVAKAYGNAVYQFEAPDELFQAWNRNSRYLPADEEARILSGLPDAARQKVEGLKSWYGSDREAFWEALRRAGGDEQAQAALRKAGFKGIEGLGDGHEVVVFDPSHVRDWKQR